MLQMIVAALLGTDSGSAGSITASWSNLAPAGAFGGSDESSSTVTFTGGGSRTLKFEHDVVIGVLKVKVDTGSYVGASSGYTVEVTTGQTVYLEYTIYGASESATLTIIDDDLSETVDTATLSFTYEGG